MSIYVLPVQFAAQSTSTINGLMSNLVSSRTRTRVLWESVSDGTERVWVPAQRLYDTCVCSASRAHVREPTGRKIKRRQWQVPWWTEVAHIIISATVHLAQHTICSLQPFSRTFPNLHFSVAKCVPIGPTSTYVSWP